MLDTLRGTEVLGYFEESEYFDGWLWTPDAHALATNPDDEEVLAEYLNIPISVLFLSFLPIGRGPASRCSEYVAVNAFWSLSSNLWHDSYEPSPPSSRQRP